MKMSNTPNYFQRIWLLLLMDAVERNAIAPIAQLRFHRLVFLTNTLAPVYDLDPCKGSLVKDQRGPFYPDIQWDIDRMVISGLLSMDTTNNRINKKDYWIDASYGLTDNGYQLVREALKRVGYKPLHNFLCEVVAAYAPLKDEEQQLAAFADATFSDSNIKNDEVIDFGEWRDLRHNYSFQATELFDQLAQRPFPFLNRDKIHLYFKYLARVADTFPKRAA
ncbi:hypothetical protein [Mariprofundus sp. EBB-1]|uniref:hypothetical protein n=1 Tax=Mariprofundus sp. EBB-1 TaxID=2650971 RepID=UPI0011C4240E|nr:hypothetical protein [Mariprofundus sp. EBB-1]